MSWLALGLTSDVCSTQVLPGSRFACSQTCLLTCASAPVASRREISSRQAGREGLVECCRVGRRLCLLPLLPLLTRTMLLLTGMLLAMTIQAVMMCRG